jgi:hypothetical protein
MMITMRRMPFAALTVGHPVATAKMLLEQSRTGGLFSWSILVLTGIDRKSLKAGYGQG